MHLTDLVAEENPDIIAITETLLNNSVSDTKCTPEGFTTFRKDRNIHNYSSGTYVQANRGCCGLSFCSLQTRPAAETQHDELVAIWDIEILEGQRCGCYGQCGV